MAKRARSISHRGQKTKAGYVPADLSESKIPDYVVVELRYEAPVAFTAARFAAPAAAAPQAESLNSVLARFDIKTMRSHFGLPASAIRSRIELAATLPAEPEPKRFAKRGMDTEFIESGFVQVVPKASEDAKKIAKALNSQRAVWKAYVAPRPVPAMPAGSAAGSRNFEPAQGYLCDAPNGIGAEDVWSLAGAKGKGITICDIEGNWNRKHEDLPTGIELLGGTPIDDLGWRNHGTAVLGEMVSISDGRGCVGISHQAKAVVHSAVINGVFNTAGAISSAATRLKAGDVMLIELQATGPNGKYVAMQFWPDIFSAIKAAVDKGITVVEAAGNGDENFELAVFNGYRPAEGQRRDRRRRRRTADQSPGFRRLRRRLPLLCFARRSALAHLLFQLRQDRQRAGMGLARDHARLRRRARRNFGEHLVHPAFFRHVERLADRDRRGGLSAGTSQSQERRSFDPQKGQGYIDVDRHAAASRPRRPADPAHRPTTKPGRGDEEGLRATRDDAGSTASPERWNQVSGGGQAQAQVPV